MILEGFSKVAGNLRRVAGIASIASLVLLTLHSQPAAQKPQLTDKEIRPILERCLQCHGEAIQMSKLDLRTREGILKGGEKGPAVLPGDSAGSLLYKRITGQQQPVMPMPPVPALSSSEIALVKDWIDQGAQWSVPAAKAAPTPAPTSVAAGGYQEKQITDKDRQWWAFQNPVRRPAPHVADERWSRNPIDAFVRDMLTKKGLEPAPEADKRTLIRRAYLDLVGLLPPPAEVEKFVNDPSPKAYENLIEKLLDSPHYGERWGRDWLDVARYADSSGFEFDITVENGWRYRDYVIKAFNEDKPYNQFIIEQLAGDELDHPTFDSLTATSLYRIGPRVRRVFI